MPDQEIRKVEEGYGSPSRHGSSRFWSSTETVILIQKVIAEAVGTYFLIFIGCGSVVVNKLYGGSVTFPGICVAWGLVVMILVYSLGHISGAHFNPAVTVTFAVFRRFPIKQVPLYIIAQVGGSLLGSVTLRVIFAVDKESFFGTAPAETDIQALVIEIMISFLLMFVISGVSTDSRAIGELAGIAVGMTILVNVLVAGPVTGASMNPARSLGPAIVMSMYKGIWVYIVGPFVGTMLGGLAYNLLRLTDKPLRELTKSSSFLKSRSTH